MPGRTETEAEFASWVIDVAQMHGWRVAHFRPARTGRGWRTPVQADGAGFPDLVLVHGGRGLGVALELKRHGGRLSPAQEAWIDALGRTGWVARVVRPCDRQEVLALLSGARAA